MANVHCIAAGKTSYPTSWEAIRLPLVLARKCRSDAAVNIWACEHCGGFHWGHQPGSGKPPERTRSAAKQRRTEGEAELSRAMRDAAE